jgi:hypothetical protein
VNEVWKGNVLRLLDEAYVQLEYRQTWFKDNQPHSSLIPAFRSLSAADAGRSPALGRNAPAGHASHLAASLEGAARAFRGVPYEVDWEASWIFPRPLSDEGWGSLCDRLEAAYLDLRGIVAENEDWADPIRSLSVMALLAHAAYHLGSVRQIAYDSLSHIQVGVNVL